MSGPGLPNGKFSNQKYQFGEILEGLGMENVGMFYGQLEYFGPFVIFYNHLVLGIVIIWCIFPRFGILCQEKSGNPGVDSAASKKPLKHFVKKTATNCQATTFSAPGSILRSSLQMGEPISGMKTNF
jgi:hypothetical protein